MAMREFPRFLDVVSEPSARPPAGSWDTACHVYADTAKYPAASGSKAFQPPYDATFDRLQALHERLGVECAVLVQPSSYAGDHRLLEDCLRAGAGQYVGVALASAELSESDLNRLDQAGVRGARFNLVRWLGTPPPLEVVTAEMARIKGRGWSTALHLDAESILEYRDFLLGISQPTCIDHMAHIGALNADGHAPALALLKELLQNDNIWIRLSNADRNSRDTRGYADAIPYLRELFGEAPERCMWGTDWPHVFYQKPHMVDDGELIDLIMAAFPGEDDIRRIMVDNPDRFYRAGR
jgi:2-pyrone-4,6-dicarboxylate lactonase